MDLEVVLPELLKWAVLLPLVSFFLILVGGRWMSKRPEFARAASLLATGAIGLGFVLSMIALVGWVGHHWPESAKHHNGHHNGQQHGEDHSPQQTGQQQTGQQAQHTKGGLDLTPVHFHPGHADPASEQFAPTAAKGGEKPHDKDKHHDKHEAPAAISGDWYTLGVFGGLRLTIGYYIDSLTICMFCMVTLIATLIHIYASGYMHEEEHDVTDHEVTLGDGSHLKRPGRYPRFFQYLSLFCFSMLGLVVAGNIAMVFVFWELVGICSYFLIGFYVERKSASTAANKAFIVNRVGDFGMIIGLMALWTSMGTFSFGDYDIDSDGHVENGLFTLARPEKLADGTENHQRLVVPVGMVKSGAREEIAELARQADPQTPQEWEAFYATIDAQYVPKWRSPEDNSTPYGYWLLVVAGVGIFCGCVGKSAQFPLHVWLPDAMEGPTPVSALVHSATMVAAGVYLVGRFFPLFAPEVLLVIAIVGVITLFLAATIAITATDIKRVLAYSTVSQLGYMMLALGAGGWLAGMLHLFTHAFFKSLLFMCSGSVIHAVHTNEMTEMGGLLRKMPWTGYTMLVGCLAIAGAGIPFVIGLSGYYSKDAILEQLFLFQNYNPGWGAFFFAAAAGGAAITAFYMFRMWYMTFVGKPRDQHRYDHAHESPKSMYVPLVILSVFAVGVAWKFFDLNLSNLLEQSRPAGITADQPATLVGMTWPDEHKSHAPAIVVPVTLIAFSTALGGFILATLFYGVGKLDPEEARRQFSGVHRFLRNKWWFDELYHVMFVKPVLVISGWVSALDRRWIDGFLDGLARCVAGFARWMESVIDAGGVDGAVNWLADRTYRLGSSLRRVQTGRLRQYVMFIAIGAVALFVMLSFYWN